MYKESLSLFPEVGDELHASKTIVEYKVVPLYLSESGSDSWLLCTPSRERRVDAVNLCT